MQAFFDEKSDGGHIIKTISYKSLAEIIADALSSNKGSAGECLKVLPTHAQEIYLAAFNRAWHQFETQADRETHTYRIAWGAVKKRYEKRDDRWVERSV